MELSGTYTVNQLCRLMDIARSSFYLWKSRLSSPSPRTQRLLKMIPLFIEYHQQYPSHGYRWLNAKIRLDMGFVLSDPYAHKCCQLAHIKSKAKRCGYKKPGMPYRVYPNLMAASLPVTGPLQCVVSDMTAFHFHGQYYELTLYMDIWNNEIIAHAVSAQRGNRMTYFNGLKDVLELKKALPGCTMVLHTDQGSVYASKAFNELLPMYGLVHSMSRAGTPTDNGALEAINGWIKAELFMDFHITGRKSIKTEIQEYITFFNEQRPAYALNYLTPKEYKSRMLQKAVH